MFHKYGDVFFWRIDYPLSLRDGLPGLLRANGFVSVFTKCCTKEAFEAWTQSEEFKHAHANRPPQEMFAGPNVFEMHEVIQVAQKK